MDEHQQGVATNGARAESTSEQGWGKDWRHQGAGPLLGWTATGRGGRVYRIEERGGWGLISYRLWVCEPGERSMEAGYPRRASRHETLTAAMEAAEVVEAAERERDAQEGNPCTPG